MTLFLGLFVALCIYVAVYLAWDYRNWDRMTVPAVIAWLAWAAFATWLLMVMA